LISFEIPLVARKNLNMSDRQMAIEVRNVMTEEVLGLVYRYWGGDCPHAEFVALQSGFEI
jgi:hypothetical protein